MPRSSKQNEQMRATTREAVISSAMRLFAQNGYAHTSTRSIAKEAGISAGLLYHYFDGKESLLRAVIEHSLARINASLGTVLETTPAPLVLTRVLQAIFALLASDDSFWALFNMLRSQPAIMDVFGEDFRYWTRCLRELFESQLIQFGRPEPKLDAYILYCLVEGTIQQYLLEPASYPLEAVVARIINQFNLPTE